MNHTQHSLSRAAPRVGFTLVEMLTIITIIVLLVCILVPSIYAGLTQAKRVQSQVILDMLDKGCQLYRDDFRELPPSGTAAGAASSVSALPPSWSMPLVEGRHMLVQFLTGFSDNDLMSGYGYRVVARGATYGPYADTERLKTAITTSGTVSLPAFIDAFGNEIYYYRYDNRGGGLSYNKFDNVSGAPPPMPNYTYSTSNGSSRYRIGTPQDFVLMTWGPNGTWEAPGTAASSDDITNFGKK